MLRASCDRDAKQKNIYIFFCICIQSHSEDVSFPATRLQFVLICPCVISPSNYIENKEESEAEEEKKTKKNRKTDRKKKKVKNRNY